MKNLTSVLMLICAFLVCSVTASVAQDKERKQETIESKRVTEKSKEVDKLKKPGNDKKPKAEPKSRGDVYGPNYSDIVVDNYTGWYIDIYVDDEYRGTLAPYDRRVTWAVPGNTKLYGKAVFDDGSYYYWGPINPETNYEYTWNLHP